MATKSVQRTLAYLRDRGHVAVVTEKWNGFSGRREDLFGFIDILALSDTKGIIGVQACGSDWAPHVRKLEGLYPSVRAWLGAGGDALLIGWRKLRMINADGKRSKVERWTPRIGEILIDGERVVVQELKNDQSDTRL